MGVKFSELPEMRVQDLTGYDYYAVLDVSDGVLKRTRVEIPLSPEHGGTGNIYGYIRRGQKSGTIIGANATAEGLANTASGAASHAEGYSSEATGEHSHAEGSGSYASGNNSHAEGASTKATGEASHAEGVSCQSSGNYSHSEGYLANATAEGAHAEGTNVTASGQYSHAQGRYTRATGNYSFAAGDETKANAESSTALGKGTIASTSNETVVGRYNSSGQDALFMVGCGSSDSSRQNAFWVDDSGYSFFAKQVSANSGLVVIGDARFTNGLTVNGSVNADTFISASGEIVRVVGNPSDTASSTLEKIKIGGTTYEIDSGGELPYDPIPIEHGGTGNTRGYIQTGQKAGTTVGEKATAEGHNTTSSSYSSHAEGSSTEATGDNSHAEGYQTKASEWATHAGGYHTVASKSCAFAHGYYSTASGEGSIATGKYSTASGDYSVVHGVGDNWTYPVNDSGNRGSFILSDNYTKKFSDASDTSFACSGTAVGCSFSNVTCTSETFYNATYGFSGTALAASCSRYRLSGIEKGGIYLLTEVTYKSEGTGTGEQAGRRVCLISTNIYLENGTMTFTDILSGGTVSTTTKYGQGVIDVKLPSSSTVYSQLSLIRIA